MTVSPLAQRLLEYVDFSRAELAAIDRVSFQRMRRIDMRRDIASEGEPPRSCFLLLEGWACRYKTLENGRRQIVAILLPGDLCDLDIFAIRERDHSIASITPVRIAELAEADLQLLAREHSRIAAALRWTRNVAAAIQCEWTLNIGQRSALERIAHLMCESYMRQRALGLARDGECPFPLTQIDIADATGLTPVHVNRVVKDLKIRRLIELPYRRLIIPDFAALCGVAAFSPGYLHLEREGRHLDTEEE